MEDWGVNVDLPDDYAVIKGKQTSKRIIEGDRLNVYGSYKSIDTYTVDGKSYTVPTINVYNVTTDDKRFDLDTIKRLQRTFSVLTSSLAIPTRTVWLLGFIHTL